MNKYKVLDSIGNILRTAEKNLLFVEVPDNLVYKRIQTFLTMITKIAKYLQRIGCEYKKDSDLSNSVYYKAGSYKIRVSDHVLPMEMGNTLHLLVSFNNNNTVVVSLNNSLQTMSYNELKNFLKAFVLIEGMKATAEQNKQVAKIKKLERRKAEVKRLRVEIASSKLSAEDKKKFLEVIK